MLKATFLMFALIGFVTGCSSKKNSDRDGFEQTPVVVYCPTDTSQPAPTNCVPIANASETSHRRFAIYLGYGQQHSMNGAAAKNFFKEAMHVCDQTDGWETGVADCDNWTSGQLNIYINVTNALASEATVHFEAYPRASWFNVNLGLRNSFAPAQNPLVLVQNIAPINDNQGFQLYSYGSNFSHSYNRRIELVVDQGKLSDPDFFVKVKFDGAILANARAVEY